MCKTDICSCVHLTAVLHYQYDGTTCHYRKVSGMFFLLSLARQICTARRAARDGSSKLMTSQKSCTPTPLGLKSSRRGTMRSVESNGSRQSAPPEIGWVVRRSRARAGLRPLVPPPFLCHRILRVEGAGDVRRPARTWWDGDTDLSRRCVAYVGIATCGASGDLTGARGRLFTGRRAYVAPT